MTLHITGHQQFNEIMDQFHDSFPNYKLEFLFTGTEKINPNNKYLHPFPFIRIEDLYPDAQNLELDIEDCMTILEVEENFRKLFHIPAQVFVKSGDFWEKKESLKGCQLKTVTG